MTMTTAYISKYALTTGIFKAEGEHRPLAEMFVTKSPDGFSSFYKMGREAFWTLEEAQGEAEDMRTKKAASLEKQLAALRTKKIKVVEV